VDLRIHQGLLIEIRLCDFVAEESDTKACALRRVACSTIATNSISCISKEKKSGLHQGVTRRQVKKRISQMKTRMQMRRTRTTMEMMEAKRGIEMIPMRTRTTT